MEETEKLKLAESYIEKLANGINPVDGKAVPDGDVINNVRVSRCLFYVSSVLKEVIAERQKAPADVEKRQKAPAVEPAEEEPTALLPKDYDVTIREMTKEINKRAAPAGIKKIKPDCIKRWFLNLEMLTPVRTNGGKECFVPTDSGKRVGIVVERHEWKFGSYFVPILSPKAQEFIIDNIDALFAFDRENRNPDERLNAGKKWEAYEEELLTKMFNENVSTKEMAKTLMRSEFAVSLRLEHLGLIDGYEEE